ASHQQKGSRGFRQARKGTCGAKGLSGGSEFDHISAASANSVEESSKPSTRTKKGSAKQRPQKARRIQLQESINILRHREENKRTRISASSVGRKDQPPYQESGSIGSPPEIRLYGAFERIKLLGTGSYSIVEEVLHLPTRLHCARKTSKADQQSQHQH